MSRPLLNEWAKIKKEKKLSSQTVQVRTAKEDQVPVPGRKDQDGFREEKSQRMNGNWTDR